eukprot:1363357-Prymnesium_polylepis.1
MRHAAPMIVHVSDSMRHVEPSAPREAHRWRSARKRASTAAWLRGAAPPPCSPSLPSALPLLR